jgi:hypothetical protein
MMCLITGMTGLGYVPPAPPSPGCIMHVRACFPAHAGLTIFHQNVWHLGNAITGQDCTWRGRRYITLAPTPDWVVHIRTPLVVSFRCIIQQQVKMILVCDKLYSELYRAVS